MNASHASAVVAAELERIPRGNLDQNLYRAAYQAARSNSLGSEPQIGHTPEDAHALALAAVRKHNPAFTPTRL